MEKSKTTTTIGTDLKKELEFMHKRAMEGMPFLDNILPAGRMIQLIFYYYTNKAKYDRKIEEIRQGFEEINIGEHNFLNKTVGTADIYVEDENGNLILEKQIISGYEGSIELTPNSSEQDSD